jgi:hydrogenase expression/formation protein HypC
MCLGIPGRIVSIEDAQNLIATVDVLGVRRKINIACVVRDGEPVAECVGAWVLVHVGFAMSRIDEAEAQETLRLLNELADLQDEMRAFSAPEAAE